MDSSSLQIRSLSLSDNTWELHAAWFIDTYFTAVEGEIQNTSAKSWRTADRSKSGDLRIAFESLLSQPEKTSLLVAFDEGAPVGYFLGLVKECIAETPSQVGYINGLYVVPEKRRKGVASKLYSKGLEWFQAREIRQFELYVPLKSHAAIEFWARNGFVASEQIMNLSLEK